MAKKKYANPTYTDKDVSSFTEPAFSLIHTEQSPGQVHSQSTELFENEQEKKSKQLKNIYKRVILILSVVLCLLFIVMVIGGGFMFHRITTDSLEICRLTVEINKTDLLIIKLHEDLSVCMAAKCEVVWNFTNGISDPTCNFTASLLDKPRNNTNETSEKQYTWNCTNEICRPCNCTPDVNGQCNDTTEHPGTRSACNFTTNVTDIATPCNNTEKPESCNCTTYVTDIFKLCNKTDKSESSNCTSNILATNISAPCNHTDKPQSCNCTDCDRQNKSGCHGGWLEYDGRCYQMVTREYQFTAVEGRRMCRQIGGDLALIKTQQDQQNLMNHVLLITSEVITWAYIGFSDGDSEGSWRWLDGTAVTYTNWAPDEPNDSVYWTPLGEDCGCVSITQSTYPPGTWNDAPCVTRVVQYLAAFCEKPVISTDKVTTQLYGELSGWLLDVSPLAEPSVDDLTQCLRQCTVNNLCLSVNYQSAELPLCELIGVTRFERGDAFKNSISWRYLEVVHPRVEEHSSQYTKTHIG